MTQKSYCLTDKSLLGKFKFTNSTTRGIQVFLLLLPGLIVFAMFTIYPLIKMFIMSFFNWKLGLGQASPFILFDNYKKVIGDPVFKIVMFNTFLYAVITVPVQLVLGLTVAVLINSINRFKVTFRVLYYLPVITSWVIVAIVFRYIFQNVGFLNYILIDVLHLANDNVKWLDGRFSALSVSMLLGIWKGIGWNMVVFLAAIQCIPIELYEVAGIDGCDRIKKFFYITIPSIKNTILFALVMLTIGAFNVFTSIKLITDGKPYHQTEVVLTWMYYKAFHDIEFGYAAALSYIVAFTITILTVIQFKYFEKFKN